MSTVTIGGNAFNTLGKLPEPGTTLPDFNLAAKDLSNKTLADFAGKNIVINVFPSLDTGTCANSVRNFNAKAGSLDNTVVLCISRDTPFAQDRFCGSEGLENVITLSDIRDRSFGKNYQLEFIDGPLQGFLSRCVIVADTTGTVRYTQQVEETADEPDYDAAIAAL